MLIGWNVHIVNNVWSYMTMLYILTSTEKYKYTDQYSLAHAFWAWHTEGYIVFTHPSVHFASMPVIIGLYDLPALSYLDIISIVAY